MLGQTNPWGRFSLVGGGWGIWEKNLAMTLVCFSPLVSDLLLSSPMVYYIFSPQRQLSFSPHPGCLPLFGQTTTFIEEIVSELLISCALFHFFYLTLPSVPSPPSATFSPKEENTIFHLCWHEFWTLETNLGK